MNHMKIAYFLEYTSQDPTRNECIDCPAYLLNASGLNIFILTQALLNTI